MDEVEQSNRPGDPPRRRQRHWPWRRVRARLVTKGGEAEVLIAHDDRMKKGTLSLPNGLGLKYPNAAGKRVAFGVAPNDLTDIEDRDPFAGTPWHKHVRARLEPIAS